MRDQGAIAAVMRNPEPAPAIPSWPAPMNEDAFYGLAGRFVRLVEPHTEADRHLLLVNFLTYAGVLMGRSRHLSLGGTRHYPNLFVVGVGLTAGGRKGSAFSPVDRILHPRILHGLSSGEGLIWNVRDPIAAQGKRGKPDPGVEDKRLLIKVSEFQGAIATMRREGNPLSAVLRCAHDGLDLELPTKNNAAKATAPHIALIGNITRDELLSVITSHDASNGLLNRFLWICSARSKQLPEGGRLHEAIESPEWKDIEQRLGRFYSMGVEQQRVCLDEDAQDVWGYDSKTGGLYRELTRGGQGLLADATARGHIYVLRLALLYSRLDSSDRIRREHLDAALAVWRYSYDSARFIFGDRVGDPLADRILIALRQAPEGMTRTDIRELLGGRIEAARIDVALNSLLEAGRARRENEDTGGRPSERWFAL